MNSIQDDAIPSQSTKQWIIHWWRTSQWLRLFILSSITGILAGALAAGMEGLIEVGTHHLIGRFTASGSGDYLHLNWGILLLPAFGSLSAGIITYAIFRLRPGHGTNVLTHAFHRKLGAMPLKAPFIKAAATSWVMSCGASVGPEGPVAALGSAIGSMLGKIMHVTAQERRILLVSGCAAGVGAVFRCPLGGALFACGLLYSETEFESNALVPAVVASVFGFSTFMLFWGFGEPMLKNVQLLAFRHPKELIAYCLLGPLCGAVGILFSLTLSGLEKRLDRIKPQWLWMIPLWGGLGTGLLACAFPQVMDGQYEFIQHVLDGDIWSHHSSFSVWGWSAFFGLIVLAKCVATSLTVGTGTPGGVLGPSVFMGGMVGAFLGTLLSALWPDLMTDPLRAAMIPVGMAGVLSGTMRIPIAATVMVAEMTGAYGLMVPLMLVSSISYLIGRRWGLNHEQVRCTADSPAHAADQVIHALESWTVADFLVPDWPACVQPAATFTEIKKLLQPGVCPVIAVTKQGELQGMISITDIANLDHMSTGDPQFIIADDIMTSDLVFIHKNENLYEALRKFEQHRHRVLPVYSTEKNGTRIWEGMLPRACVAEALHKHMNQLSSEILCEHEFFHSIKEDASLEQVFAPLTHGSDHLQRLMVPASALGKTLRETNFRKTKKMEVVAIEMPDGTLLCPADPNLPLNEYHRLLVLKSNTSTQK